MSVLYIPGLMRGIRYVFYSWFTIPITIILIIAWKRKEAIQSIRCQCQVVVVWRGVAITCSIEGTLRVCALVECVGGWVCGKKKTNKSSKKLIVFIYKEGEKQVSESVPLLPATFQHHFFFHLFLFLMTDPGWKKYGIGVIPVVHIRLSFEIAGVTIYFLIITKWTLTV